MKEKRILLILVILIAVVSAIAACMGIFSNSESAVSHILSVRGSDVELYQKGIYSHMSFNVGIQGVAQDYVTLFLAIPLLIFFLFRYRKGYKRAGLLLAGTLFYFFVTYLFYFCMAMYNCMFLAYVALMGLSFYALYFILKSLKSDNVEKSFHENVPNKIAGGFLIFNSIIIALMWIGVIITPLANGYLYPADLQHYTTMIVQGFDLGILLPLSFILGLSLRRKSTLGLIYGSIYLVFLSLLMTALSAKIFAMAMNHVNVIPAVIIIPAINLLTIVCSVALLKKVAAH